MNDDRRLGNLRIPVSVLDLYLYLPHGTEILGGYMDPTTSGEDAVLMLKIRHPDLPPAGTFVPVVDLLLSTTGETVETRVVTSRYEIPARSP